MSGTQDKSKTRTRVARDKTVVRPGAGLEAVWPETGKPESPSEEPAAESAPEPDTTLPEQETSNATPTKSRSIKSDEPADSGAKVETSADKVSPDSNLIWPEAVERPEALPDEAVKQTETASEIRSVADATETAPDTATESPTIQSQAATLVAASGETAPATVEAQRHEEVSETVPDAQENAATVETSTSSGADDTEDGPPPEAPRIEVPVQQQYASLFAALGERIEQHPGGHDLLAVLRMLEGQTAPGAASSGMDPKKADEPAPPRIGKSRRMMEDIVRFGQDPSSEFATSTIERATKDGDGGLVLLERFLGLLGPQAADDR